MLSQCWFRTGPSFVMMVQYQTIIRVSGTYKILRSGVIDSPDARVLYVHTNTTENLLR